MQMHYNIELKKKLCEDICLHGKSTSLSAKQYNVPLKTLEKWITAYNFIQFISKFTRLRISDLVQLN